MAERAFQKIVFQCQLAYLGMKQLQIYRGFGPAACCLGPKYSRRSLQEMGFPLRDLIDVNVELLCQLGQGLVTFQGSQSHFRFKSRAMVPPYSLLHNLS